MDLLRKNGNLPTKRWLILPFCDQPPGLGRIDTSMKVFFCDPRSPWQRGIKKNKNGLLRQYFPKATNLSEYRVSELDEVALVLNTRPRKILGLRTPAEASTELRSPAKATAG